jgi:hypothetical protein
MSASSPPALPAPGGAPLAAALAAIDVQLAALTSGLQARDAQAVEASARLLASAVEASAPVLRGAGPLPAVTNERLAHAMGRVAAQREALTRATAAVQRALVVLCPAQAPAPTYTASGYAQRPPGSGSAWA